MGIIKLIAAVMAVIFAVGCSPKTPEGNVAGGKKETIDKKEISSFYYYHRGTMIEDIYDYKFYRDENGAHMTAELSSGWEKLEVDVDDEIIKQLEDIAFEYQMYYWDGFNKTDKRVLDGEGFTLEIAFADGTSVYANGSNAFPDGFSQAEDEFNTIFFELKNIHADKIMENDPYNYDD